MLLSYISKAEGLLPRTHRSRKHIMPKQRPDPEMGGASAQPFDRSRQNQIWLCVRKLTESCYGYLAP